MPEDRCLFARKITYLSMRAARQACFDDMAPYLCREYPHWHVGHPWKQRRAALRAMVHDAEAQGLYERPELPAEEATRP